MKKETIRKACSALIWCPIGIFLGQAISLIEDYVKYPELFAAQSAPWYTGLLIPGGITALVVATAILVKRKLK